jgi:tetratricopeptide (TPR) repeat protein
MKYVLRILLLALILSPLALNAQINKATEFMGAGKYSEAVQVLESARLQGAAVQADLINLAYCYLMLHDYAKAEEVYAVLVEDKNIEPKQIFFYGEVLRINGKYNEAKKRYQQFLEKVPGDYETTVRIASCDSIPYWNTLSTRIIVNNETSVNTVNDEVSPLPLDELTFVSNNRELLAKAGVITQFVDPQVSFIYSNAGANPKTISYFSDSVSYLCINAAGSKRAVVIKSVKKTPDGEKLGNSVIMIGSKTEGFKEFKPEGIPEGYVTTHPCLSQDGKRIYYSSNIPGGKGGIDLYYSDFNGAQWSAPVNLGANVNTPGDEMFPWISKDGATLYFASNGHPGYGNLDLFSSVLISGNWTTPRNLKAPLNSVGNDFSLIFGNDPYAGYLVSNRFGASKGGNDIFSFQLPKPGEAPVDTVKPLAEVLPTDTVLVFYATASAMINTQFNDELSGVVATMKKYPYLKINVETWADTRGSEALNNRLCVERAKIIADRLIANGITSDRILSNPAGITRSGNSKLVNYHVQVGFLSSSNGIDYFKKLIKEDVPIACLPYGKGYAYFAGLGNIGDMKKLASKIRTKYGIAGFVTASYQDFYLADCTYAPCRRAVLYFSK